MSLLLSSKCFELIKICENCLTCSICSKEMVLPCFNTICDHRFCSQCISTNQFCPSCNKNIPSKQIHIDRLYETVIGTIKQLKSVSITPQPVLLSEKNASNKNEKGCKIVCLSNKSNDETNNSNIVISNENKENSTVKKNTKKGGPSSLNSKRAIEKVVVADILLTANQNIDQDNRECKKIKSDTTTNMKETKPIKMNKLGETPLHLACKKGNLSKVQELLKEKIDVNHKDNAGWTALHESINKGNLDLVLLLLENGANVNIKGYNNITPLEEAIENDNYEIANALIRHGAKLDKSNIRPDFFKSSKMENLLHSEKTVLSDIPDIIDKKDSVNKLMKPTILFSGIIEPERNALKKIVSSLNGKILEDFTDQITHIVVLCDKDQRCPKTLKYLMGIASGKCVISHGWLEECNKLSSWIDESSYVVGGCNNNNNNGIPLKIYQLTVKNNFIGILAGLNVYVHSKLKLVGMNKEDFINLLKYAGAIILKREPKDSSKNNNEDIPYHAKSNSIWMIYNKIVIKDDNDENPNRSSIISATTSWSINCIINYDLSEP